MWAFDRFHNISPQSISTVRQSQLASIALITIFSIGRYPLNTLSGSTDIAGMEYISTAILASVGYSLALPLHHSSKSNPSAAAPDNFRTDAFEYRVTSSSFSSISPNHHALISNFFLSFSCSGTIGGDIGTFSDLYF